MIDGSTFGGPGNYSALRAELDAGGIPAYRVQRGDDLAAALSQSARIGEIPEWIARR